MTRAIVPVPSPEEREYARLLLLIETRKRRIAALETERNGLEMALSRFAVELKARVGGIRTEINRVRLQTAEYRRRLERLKEDESLDPATVEQEVAEEFADQREEERLREEATQREGQRVERQQTRPHLGADGEAEVLRLYRELAKRFHPDLARGDKERKRRAELMLRINVAYRERDLLALQTIAREAEAVDPAFAVLSMKERLAWARRVIARLDGQIADLQGQLDLLQESETFTLWQSPETSRQSVIDLETRVRERLSRERDRLDRAILDYNRLRRRRRMPRTAGAAR